MLRGSFGVAKLASCEEAVTTAGQTAFKDRTYGRRAGSAAGLGLHGSLLLLRTLPSLVTSCSNPKFVFKLILGKLNQLD